MTCETVWEWISAALDGEAGPEEGSHRVLAPFGRETAMGRRQAIRRHLAGCDACRQASAAAVSLRERLARVGVGEAAPDLLDEPLFAALRREGIIRGPAPQPALGARMQRGWARWAAEVRAALGPTLRPALAAVAVSFLLTWSSLRWIESGRGTGTDRRTGSMATATAPRGEVLERWLDGPPTLAALAQLQAASPPHPETPKHLQRSDRSRPRGRVG